MGGTGVKVNRKKIADWSPSGFEAVMVIGIYSSMSRDGELVDLDHFVKLNVK